MGEALVDQLPVDSVEDGQKWRLRPYITLAKMAQDLDRKDEAVQVYKRSQMYIMVIIVMTIFYVMFPLQTVVWLTHSLDSGQQDFCYYNFSCLRPLGSFLPFNSIISNSSYILAGLLFLDMETNGIFLANFPWGKMEIRRLFWQLYLY